MNKIFKIKEEEGKNVSVQTTNVEVSDGKHTKHSREITFLVENVKKEDLTQNNDLIISLSIDEANKLASTINDLCKQESVQHPDKNVTDSQV